VRNYHLAVRERGSQVEYLHRVEPGRAEKSFGIYVAQMAGLPKPVIRRAEELLRLHDCKLAVSRTQTPNPAAYHPLLETLLSLDVNQLSPVEALTKLYELQQQAGQTK
jgi:DNA mismatch repair protein MutS